MRFNVRRHRRATADDWKKLLHEAVRHSHALFGGLVIGEYDFELEKVAQALDFVQMNPGSTDEKPGYGASERAQPPRTPWTVRPAVFRQGTQL